MRTYQAPVALGATLLVAMLAGCAAPAPVSELEGYEAHAEQLHTQLLAQLPVSVEQTVRTSSRAWLDQAGAFGPTAHDAAHWTTESTVEFDDNVAPAAADAVAAYLVAERWEEEVTVDHGGSVPYVNVYRLADGGEEWIVQVAWDDEQHIVLIVQSPLTVRGATQGS